MLHCNTKTRKKKSPKQVAFGYPPRSLLRHLQQELPGFSDLPESHQTGYVSLLWSNIGSKRYSHAIHDGYFTAYYIHLDRVFGRQHFKTVNARFGLFDVIERWDFAKGLTKAYRPSEKAPAILDSYLNIPAQKERLISDTGGDMDNRARAIKSRDINFLSTKDWRQVRLAVPIDTKALYEGIDAMKYYLDQYHFGDKWLPKTPVERYIAKQAEPIGEPDIEEWTFRRIRMAQGILKMAYVPFLDGTSAPQQYVESASGRLYGEGLHLQNVAKEVKVLALNGGYEYDFENCHYSLVSQLAKRHDVQTPMIDDYLAHKAAIRAEIALEAGIARDQAKLCLIALIYGARMSQRAVDAIPDEIGQEAAQRLYSNELFKGIANDVREARKAIVSHLREAKNNARGAKNGFISNARNKTIKRDAPVNEILAHILQGLEAKMLCTAIDNNLDEILLLQHDGFTTIEPIDRAKIEQEIHQKTGFEMSLVVKKLSL